VLSNVTSRAWPIIEGDIRKRLIQAQTVILLVGIVSDMKVSLNLKSLSSANFPCK